MWLNVYIPKKHRGNYDVQEIAALRGLSCGVLACKPILREGRTGKYTRLYDPTYMGVAMECHQDDTCVELTLYYPATPYDIDLYFRLVADVCRLEGTPVFYMDADPIPITDIENVIHFYIERVGQVFQYLQEEFDRDERVALTVFGCRFPMILGPQEMRALRCDIYEYAFLLDRLQRTKVPFGDPDVYLIHRNHHEFGCYRLYPGQPCILPLNPKNLLLPSYANLTTWVVDFGWAHFKYEDFIQNVSTSQRFDEEHCIICVEEETVDEFARRFGYEPFSEKMIYQASWGMMYSDMDGNFHADKVPQKGLDTDMLNGYSHEAAYLRWCACHDLLNEKLLRTYPDLLDLILGGADDLRVLVRDHEAFRGVIRRYHFNEEGRKFSDRYFHDKDSYPACVDAFSEEYFGPEEYNNPAYQTEAYLFIPFDEAYEEGIGAYIDWAWKRLMEDKAD